MCMFHKIKYAIIHLWSFAFPHETLENTRLQEKKIYIYIFKSFCVHLQKLCIPPRTIVFTLKSSAFSHKNITFHYKILRSLKMHTFSSHLILFPSPSCVCSQNFVSERKNSWENAKLSLVNAKALKYVSSHLILFFFPSQCPLRDSIKACHGGAFYFMI